MMDKEGFELYTRRKIDLQNRLSDIGEYRGSSEIESQIIFIEGRLTAKIKQAYSHAAEEMHGLSMILLETTRNDEA
jgi:hypothetical protein